MTRRTVEINPGDTSVLGIANGDPVKLSSRRGEVKAKAKATRACPKGVVSMSLHFAESPTDRPTNQLTNQSLDPVSNIPELKVCAVKVEKIAPGQDGAILKPEFRTESHITTHTSLLTFLDRSFNLL